MKRVRCPVAIVAALGFTAPAVAGPILPVPGGEIGTLEQGRYTCEMPGDAAGPVGHHVADADFTVISASSYRAAGTLGSYLLTGDRLVMTNGPHKGRKFHRLSRGFLRQVAPDGSDGPLRCVLGRRNAGSPRCPDVSSPEDPLLQNREARAATHDRLAHCPVKDAASS